jgi:hypothetical protein
MSGHDAERRWRDSLDALASQPRSREHVWQALGAAGRLLFAGGEPSGIESLIGSVQIDRSLGADELEPAAIALVDAMEAEEGDAVIDALELRHEIEARCFALEALGAPLGDAARSAMLVFDGLVRPYAWRLVRWNVARERRANAIAPAFRTRCWWWCAGAGLDPRAVESLEAVAMLAARFPKAKAALDGAVATARAWAGETLGAWIRSVAGDSAACTLIARDDVHISWHSDALIVDLSEPSAIPTLRIGARVLEGEVAGTNRYRFAIDLDATDAELTISLPSGARSIGLPP